MKDLSNHVRLTAAAAAALLLVAGCETAGKRTAIGAGAGGLAGAGLGALLGGGKGALIGAGVGAVAGGSVGLYLDKQHKELEQIAETKKTDNGLLVQMKGDILFDTGSAVLKPEAIDQLTKVGDVLAKYSDDRIRVEGYTDSQGKASYNEDLSARRADSVKRVLVGRGVQEKQITSLGMGAVRPVADNGTADGRAKNRRVELHIDVPNAT
jgi:outer membrane protein OmpA-like peptidoglycan-associated protein